MRSMNEEDVASSGQIVASAFQMGRRATTNLFTATQPFTDREMVYVGREGSLSQIYDVGFSVGRDACADCPHLRRNEWVSTIVETWIRGCNAGHAAKGGFLFKDIRKRISRQNVFWSGNGF